MAGYFVLHTKWHTLDHLGDYQAGAQAALAQYGAKSLVYDTRPEVVEVNRTSQPRSFSSSPI